MKTIKVNQIFSLVFVCIIMILNFTEANAKNSTIHQTDEVERKTMNVRLYTANSYYANSTSSDAFVIHFTSDGYNGIDHRDVPIISNFDENIARFHSGELLVVENRALPKGNESLAIFINQYTTVDYVLRFDVPEFDEVNLSLVDQYTGKTHSLKAGENIVHFSINDSNASRAHNRFSMEFDQATLDTRNFENTNAVSLYPNPVSSIYFHVDVPRDLTGDVLIEIFNSQGRKVNQVLFRNRTTHSLKIDSAKLNQGVYYLKVQGNHNLNKTLKFIKS